MHFLQQKKAFVTHPIALFVSGVVLGFVLIILWAKGIINLPFPFCTQVIP